MNPEPDMTTITFNNLTLSQVGCIQRALLTRREQQVAFAMARHATRQEEADASREIALIDSILYPYLTK